MTELTVLILTPISKEYQALRKHLEGPHETIFAPELYEKWTFKGKFHTYSIVIREPGAKVADMALATERAIGRFQPEIALLMGIAGGVKDVKIGDVVVANKIYNIDSGKESEDGFDARPDVQKVSKDLLARVQKLERDNNWQARIKVGDSNAILFQGAIASSDKLIANVNNPTFQRIKKHLNDTICVEMEASGFAKSVEMHPKVHGLVIRGISDLCAGKSETDKLGSQEIAADHAAAFVFELLWELDASSFIIPTMDTKTLAKEIYTLLFPLPESVKEIKNDFADAANNEVREIWKRVKPLFIKEVEELQKSPNDADAQADVRNGLKRALEGKEDLQQELAALLKKAEGQGSGGSISVVGSKNVVAGSTIVVKEGGFRLGDG